MGESRAYKHMAVGLDAKSRAASSPEAKSALFNEAQSYAEGCVQLGDADCARTLMSAYRAQGLKDEEFYWLLIGRMLGSTSEMETFAQYYEQNLSDGDRALLARIMRERSPSGGDVSSGIKGLPGRSTLTAAFVDAMMRHNLEFVWGAFFSPSAPDESVEKVFGKWQSTLTPQLLVAAYLLTPQPSGTKSRSIISVKSTDTLGMNLLPGDQIIARCGSLTHMAEFWAFESDKRSVLLLDPFYEFWQPSHNACVKAMKLVPYRYRRDLVRISIADLSGMLEAVLTIRDRTY